MQATIFDQSTGHILRYVSAAGEGEVHKQLGAGESFLSGRFSAAESWVSADGTIQLRERVDVPQNLTVEPSEALTGLPPFAYLNICGDIFCTDGDGQLEVTLGEGVYPVELIGRYVAAPSVLQVQGLESRRRELKASVKALRDLHETSGCATPLGRVDTNPDSQRKISGAVQMAMLSGDAFSIDWRMADDSVVTHSRDQMVSLGLSVGKHVDACQSRKNELDAVIAACTSLSELNALDITSGWPGDTSTTQGTTE